ncbi:MAG: IS21-like element ISCARN65 family transposase, partial [Stellaceae bacterium]
MTDQQAILGLLRLGWGIRRVARETGHRYETVRRLRRAGRPAVDRGGKIAHLGQSDRRPGRGAEPEAPADSTSKPSRSSCARYRPFIGAELAKGRNAQAIYQDLVEHHGYAGSYQAVKRFARTLDDRERHVFCRFGTGPGQEGQVDYGEGAPTRDARSGKYPKPRLFVLTLGFSRQAFSQDDFGTRRSAPGASLHEEAFAHFG